MGALAGMQQRSDVLAMVDRLKTQATVVTGGGTATPIDADAERGAFVKPTLLRCDTPDSETLVDEVEAFGPVSTLMSYADTAQPVAFARAGKGSLVMSLFSHDPAVVGEAVLGAASSHGRTLIGDRDSAADSTGHGAALPHLLHGGPGRAGGGENGAV